jgi:uncharacterized protein (TIGR02266 family)
MAEREGANPPDVDRREFARVPARVEVRLKAEQAARALRAYSLNFSVGGICLKTQKDYQVGDQLQLSMTIEGRDFELRGVVAWVRPGVAVGVRFDELSQSDRERLTQVVSALGKK